MRDFLNIVKALSDENRLRALMLLRGGQLCLCQIIEMLRLAPSTVSKHMAVLRQAGLVEVRKKGRWRYYRLPGKDAPRPVREAVRWALNSVNNEKQILDDVKRLKIICKMKREKLCVHYRR